VINPFDLAAGILTTNTVAIKETGNLVKSLSPFKRKPAPILLHIVLKINGFLEG
jgi:hypothetical protein